MDAIPAAWLRRNVFQPWEGGLCGLVMYRATVDWATSTPSISSSPWIRGAVIAFRIEGKNRYSQTKISRSMLRSHTRDGDLRLVQSPADGEPGFQPRGSHAISIGSVRGGGAWSGTRASRLPVAQLSFSVTPDEVFGSDRTECEFTVAMLRTNSDRFFRLMS